MEGRNNYGEQPKGARLAFGIFMVLFYIGVGILVMMDVFNFFGTVSRYIIGILLCLYGVFRGYRLYAGKP